MKSTLKYISEKQWEATNDSGNTVSIDMLDPEEKNSQSPMQLVLSAVASCAAVDIVSMIKKRRKTFMDLSAETTANRAENHPRKFTDIHVQYKITSPDLTEKEAERIVGLAVSSYCSVASSLDPAIKLTHGFEINRP